MELINFSERDDKPFSQITQILVKSQEKLKNKNNNASKKQKDENNTNDVK